MLGLAMQVDGETLWLDRGIVGDVNGDGIVEPQDVDVFCESLPGDNPRFDVDRNGVLDLEDVDAYVAGVLAGSLGSTASRVSMLRETSASTKRVG